MTPRARLANSRRMLISRSTAIRRLCARWISWSNISNSSRAVGRSGTDDPDAGRRVCLCDPFGAAICREVQVNLAYRWFCDLGIEDAIPDHSAFSRARNERFRESDVFRRVFERVVEACIAAGLGRWRRLCRRCEPDRRPTPTSNARSQARIGAGIAIRNGPAAR